MNKLKLIALTYGPEDEQAMFAWQSAYANLFEITEWSVTLDVPVQSAVKHYCEAADMDGLLIDRHHAYDSIVMKRLDDILKIAKLNLYSTTNSNLPVIAHAPAQKSNEDQRNNVSAFSFSIAEPAALNNAVGAVRKAG